MKSKPSEFDFRDKIILLEFVTSITQMKGMNIDPLILESANKLKQDAINDVSGSEVKFLRLRDDILQQVNSSYHVN